MPSDQKDKKRQPRYIALAGIGLQMGITIYLFSYVGKYLDEKYPNEKNYWTIGLTLLGVVISFYHLLKKVNHLNNQDK